MSTILEQPRVWFSKKTSRQLKSLKPVFEKLNEVHKSYIKREPSGDLSYCYPERPQVGLLATAAYLSKFSALEEYSTKKKKDQKKAPGRCDLYIRTNRKTSFECEAKWLPVNLRESTDELVQKVERRMKEAESAAKQLLEPNHNHIAFCFVTTKIKQPKDREARERSLEFVERLKPANGHPRCDALVWIPGPQVQKDDWFYPGLLLAVKQA